MHTYKTYVGKYVVTPLLTDYTIHTRSPEYRDVLSVTYFGHSG